MNKAIKVIAGLVSLSLVLLYNFVHTGNVLAAFVDPQWVGYAAAFGIESIVIFLSMQISERRKIGRDTKLFVGALVAVVVVSAFANIAQGYLVKFGKPLEMVVFGVTDFAQLVVWLSSTGLLSLVTFAMAEIIGDDITASKAQPTASTPQVTDEDCHCPICNDVIGLPVWLFEQHGDKYIAYCDKCQRAYAESEVVWLPSTSQVGASLTQPIAQGPQEAETDEIGPLSDDIGQDTEIESSHMPLGSVSSVSVPESALTTVITKSPLESPVLSTVSFDDYQLTGDTRADLRALLVLAPLATNASLARKMYLSPERVRQVRLSLSREAQGVTK